MDAIDFAEVYLREKSYGLQDRAGLVWHELRLAISARLTRRLYSSTVLLP
jgi:hypothetical protein